MRKLLRFLLLCSLILCICLFGLLIHNEVVNSKRIEKSHVEKVSRLKSPVENQLTWTNRIGVNNLSGLEKKAVSEYSQKIIKHHFIGSYVGTDNKNLLFSGSNGYANAKVKAVFQLNTAYLVGNYQELLNNYIIYKLADNNKIKLTDKVGKYILLSSDSSVGEVTIDKLLNSDTNYYCNRKIMESFATIENRVNNHEEIKINAENKNNDVRVNSAIKALIISKALNTSYEEAFKKIIIDGFRLTDTRFYKNTTDGQANDVEGYKYSTIRKVPVQIKKMKIDSIYYGTNQLRMSMKDIIISFDSLFSKEGLLQKNQESFVKSVAEIKGFQNLTKKKIQFKMSQSGQNVFVRLNQSNNRLVIIGTNFPNSNVKPAEVMDHLFKIVNR